MAKEVKTSEEKQEEKKRRAERQAVHKEQERKSFITKHGFNIRKKSKEDATLFEAILKDIIEYRIQFKYENSEKERLKRIKLTGAPELDVQHIKSRNPTVATVREAAQLFDIVKSNPNFRPSYLPSLKGMKI